jgi:hypothetical protein
MKTTCLLILGWVPVLLAQNDDALRRQKKLEVAADELKTKLNATRQTFEFVSGQLISGPPVKGAPYSAEAVTESIQTLADGNRIVLRSSAMQYRDNDGRERREETSAMGAVFITDPVAGERYTLHPDSRSAEKGPLQAFTVVTNGPAGDAYFYVNNGGIATVRAGVEGPVTVAINGRGGPGRSGEQPAVIGTAGRGTAGRGAAVGGKDAKVEPLGNMYIEGVQAQGTRTTTTIPAGDIGNERPINIVDERWYSPDLQMTVMTKHSDPMSGDTSFQLRNINRSSPPPHLFEVPSDYTVRAGGGRGGRSGGPVPANRVAEPKK